MIDIAERTSETSSRRSRRQLLVQQCSKSVDTDALEKFHDRNVYAQIGLNRVFQLNRHKRVDSEIDERQLNVYVGCTQTHNLGDKLLRVSSQEGVPSTHAGFPPL